MLARACSTATSISIPTSAKVAPHVMAGAMVRMSVYAGVRAQRTLWKIIDAPTIEWITPMTTIQKCASRLHQWPYSGSVMRAVGEFCSVTAGPLRDEPKPSRHR